MASEAQCSAITEQGTRCSRPAGEDGFCYQHSPADEAVAEGADAAETDDQATDDSEDRRTTMSNTSTDSEIGAIRAEVADVAEDIVGYPLSGITSIDHGDDTWTVAVEVVERKSVPDTQDILGRYELTLDEDRKITGYHRTHRYRRDDTQQDV
ncbi:gas vesicle protein GvpO, halophile-type [Halobacterium wangiae]|uniref:gas vesicle protein GvpO, halophile-type n=1 Tax=Halobacterium wangiae TaxID=2902623 RepID=UPI001E620661|nr:gas vesicle protein GvpO [Halobacterium wangiae]